MVGGTQEKNFFLAFPRGRKNTSYLHFDNNNRVDESPLIGQAENNEIGLNGKQSASVDADWTIYEHAARDLKP